MKNTEHKYCPYCMSAITAGKTCPNCGLTEGNYTPAPHHLPPGTILSGRYLIGRVLGEGGFGITYIGCDLRLELKVAIKEYFPTDRASRQSEASLDVISFAGSAGKNYEMGKERFLYEARTMARMEKQPQIVSVRDFFEGNNTAYIVMEYVAGTNLKDLVAQRGGRIPPEELLPTLKPLFKALQEMHNLGLIHRDISPDNLMMENGSIRLLDFGCARESTSSSETLTIVLKQGYAPIEQYTGNGQGPWTDVYALAATIYYCLTGKTPPRSADRIQILDELIHPRRMGINLTDQQERALLKALAVMRNQRYQTIQEFAAALYDESSPHTDLPPVPPPPPPPAPEDVEEPEEEVSVILHTQEETPKTEEDPRDDKTRTQQIQQPPLWKRPWIWAAAGVAVIVLLLAILLPGNAPAGEEPIADPAPGASLQAPDDQSAQPDQAPQEAPGPQTPQIDWSAETEVFFEGDDESQLLALLADNSNTMVTIRSGTYVGLTQAPLTLTKRLRLEPGANINAVQPIRIAQGGQLIVQGDFSIEGFLQTDGGSICVMDGGWIHGAMLYLDTEVALQMEVGGNMDEHTYDTMAVVDEDVIFASAQQVHSWAELVAAAQSGSTSSIDVVESFSVEENLTIQVPMRVASGVTLSSPQASHWDFGTGPTIFVGNTVLVNYGVLNTYINCFSDNHRSTLVNYGVLGPDLFVGDHVETTQLLNFGTMDLTVSTIHSAYVCNLGTWNTVPAGNGQGWWTAILKSWVYNGGQWTIQGSGPQQGIHILHFNGNGNAFANAGTLTLGAYGEFRNLGHFWNNGVLTMDDPTAMFNNSGVVNTTGVIRTSHMNNWYSDGVVCYTSADTVQTAGPVQAGSQIHFSSDNANSIHVQTEKELRQALLNPDLTHIVLDDDNVLELTEDLTISHKTLVIYVCQIQANGHTISLSGSEAKIYAPHALPIDMGGGSMVIENGAVAVISAIENAGTLSVSDNASFSLCDWGTFYDGSTISVSKGGWLNNYGWMHLTGATVQVLDDGTLRNYQGMQLDASHIQIFPAGEFQALQGEFVLNLDSTMTNQGYTHLLTMHNSLPLDIYGAIENSGWMDLSYGQRARLMGTLHNSGTLQLDHTELMVYGSVQNDGRVLCFTTSYQDPSRLEARDGGSVSGNAVLYPTEFYRYVP